MDKQNKNIDPFDELLKNKMTEKHFDFNENAWNSFENHSKIKKAKRKKLQYLSVGLVICFTSLSLYLCNSENYPNHNKAELGNDYNRNKELKISSNTSVKNEDIYNLIESTSSINEVVINDSSTHESINQNTLYPKDFTSNKIAVVANKNFNQSNKNNTLLSPNKKQKQISYHKEKMITEGENKKLEINNSLASSIAKDNIKSQNLTEKSNLINDLASLEINNGSNSDINQEETQNNKTITEGQITAKKLNNYSIENESLDLKPPLNKFPNSNQDDSTDLESSKININISKSDSTNFNTNSLADSSTLFKNDSIEFLTSKDSIINQTKIDSTLVSDSTKNQKIKLHLGIQASPYIVSISNDFNTSFGTNLALRYKKTAISFGLIYEFEKINMKDNNFNPSNLPWKNENKANTIISDTRVINIPILASYYLPSYKSYNLAFTVGVNSLFLLKENYKFNYNNANPFNTNNIGGSNINNHLFGMGSFEFLIEREFTNHSLIQLSPYLNYTFSDIGYGNMKYYRIGLKINYAFSVINKN